MRAQLVIVVAVVFSSLTTAARTTIEALVIDSTVICRARFEGTTKLPASNDGPDQAVTVRIIEMLKGPPQARLTFPSYDNEDSDELRAIESGDEFLLCFGPTRPWRRTPRARQNWPMELRHFYNLSRGQRAGGENVLLNLAIKDLDDPREILHLARRELSLKTPTTQTTEISADRILSFSDKRWDSIAVPLDKRCWSAARLWMKSPMPVVRSLAIDALSRENTPESLELIKSMSEDNAGVEATWRISPWGQCLYPIRQQAHSILKYKNIKTTAALEKPTELYHRVSVLPWLTLLPLTWLASGIIRRRRCERLGRAPVELFRHSMEWGCVILLIAAAAMVVLWCRSEIVSDDWVVAADSRMYEVTSNEGGLRFEILSGCPSDVPLVHTAVKLRPLQIEHGLWVNDTLYWHCFGAELGTLNMPCDRFYFDSQAAEKAPWSDISGAADSRGWLLIVPFRGVVALLCLAPGLWVAGIGFRSLRRRRRVRRGLCAECGYDLRASLDRCPECGREKRDWKI